MGDGINPGTIRPMPFSIQMPINRKTEAGSRTLGLFLPGFRARVIVASTFKVMEVQIQGTSEL